QRPAATLAAAPAQKETDQLPERVEAEASRHDRIALEVAAEEPKVRLHVEFSANEAPAIFTPGVGNFADTVEHQHRGQRQLCIARAKHLAAAAGQQILVFVTATPIQHRCQPLSKSRWSVLERNGPFRAGSAPIILDWREYRRSGCPCGNRRSPLPKSQSEIAKLSPRALYHRPRGRQSTSTG